MLESQYAALSDAGSRYEAFRQLIADADTSTSVTVDLPTASEESLVRHLYLEVTSTAQHDGQNQRLTLCPQMLRKADS